MFMTIEKMASREGFINTGKAVYQDQQAALCINKDLEKSKVRKGTRQGCPLSPLVFVMVLEVLLREDKDVKGLKLKGFPYKYNFGVTIWLQVRSLIPWHLDHQELWF